MTTRVKLETKGFEEYLERLVAASLDVDQAAAEALEAGGAVLVDGMKSRAPKDTHNLEEHIDQTEVKQDGNFSFIEVGVLKADADTARYANAQEYGWQSKKGHRSGQKYIRPTLDEDMAKARRRMKEVFLSWLEKK